MVKSMYAAVAGLRTHQAKMDVIGNNISNINTFAFKKARATFRDQFYQTMWGSSNAGLVYGGGNPSQVGYGTSLSSIEVDFGTASGAPTGNGMDVMINGNGFFLVGQYNGLGIGTTSRPHSDPAVMNMTSLSLTRVGIFNIDGNGNLVDSGRNYVYGYDVKYVPLLDEEGNQVLDTNGDPVMSTEREVDRSLLQMLSVPLIWMNPDGSALRGASGESYVTVPYLGRTGADGYEVHPVTGERLLVGDSGGVTKAELEADPPEDGAYLAPMKLYNISIGQNGTVVGMNEWNEPVVIGVLAIANVPNPNALESEGNGYYKAKENTGTLTAEEAGGGGTGLLRAGALEMANVDLAQEFTDMITTQRGFQANGRIITVTDEMLAELINLKR